MFALARGLPTPDATIENRYVDVAGWSKGFIGMLGSVSYIFAAIFVVIFASSLKHVRFRKILIVLQICSSLLSALDLILVCVAKDALWGYVRRTVLVRTQKKKKKKGKEESRCLVIRSRLHCTREDCGFDSCMWSSGLAALC